ncbi:MAG: D-alanine--D-alanine ligase [Desulfobacterota bacterium]|nr:D-alanine--D-alanine ligase [Thermodesulfobacteriota bacterium]
MKIVIAVAHDISGRRDVVDVLRCARSIAAGLSRRGHEVQIRTVAAVSAATVEREIISACPDCVFNLFEGFAHDAACEADFAALLEARSIPFTGNSAQTLRLCLNKAAAKEVLTAQGVPVPQGICLRLGDPLPDRLPPFPVFVKPCCEDASVGIDKSSLVHTREALPRIVRDKLFAFPAGVLVESFLAGTEYNVGCIGLPPYEIIGISAMVYGIAADMPPFMTYTAKWHPETPEYRSLVPDPDPAIDHELRQQIAAIAEQAGRALGCRGYFRVDIREDQGTLYVIDVNPNPDINEDSGFMRQAYARGRAYDEVLDKIVETAIQQDG